MALVFRCVGGALICAVLVTVLHRQNKDMALVLQMLVSVLLLGCAVGGLTPVIRFLAELEQIGGLNSDLVDILFKVTGIALVTEIAAMICVDSGNASLGKGLQMVAGAVILQLAMPAFSALLDLLKSLLEVT